MANDPANTRKFVTVWLEIKGTALYVERSVDSGVTIEVWKEMAYEDREDILRSHMSKLIRDMTKTGWYTERDK